MAHGGVEFCLDPSYTGTFNILNIPSLISLATDKTLSTLLGGLATNASLYTASPSSIVTDNFTYELITSLPLTKPLLIQCPVPACIFPVSGYFTLLQRLLFYINMIVALVALNVPILRGVAQIWLTTFWFSALMMFLATILTTKIPMVYNLDLQPALIVVHTGLLPSLLWFSFRAEPGSPKDHSGHKPQTGWFRKRVLDYPVTRLLVPLYAIWGLMNVILANVVQDSAGFWPKATAVILSNETSYLLTSPCYQDDSGSVGLWPPVPSPYTGIRNISSLSIYFPPAGMKAVDSLLAVPKFDLTILHVGTVLLCLVIILLSLIKLTWLQNWLHKKYPHLRPRTIRYLAILPFTIPLILATALTLYVIIVYETNSRRVRLPENEAYTEIGQWGPYVTAFLVLVATLVAKWRDWDFDNSGSSGFEWLLNEERDDIRYMESGALRSESRERLMRREAEIPFVELGWGEQPLELGMLAEAKMMALKRSRSF